MGASSVHQRPIAGVSLDAGDYSCGVLGTEAAGTTSTHGSAHELRPRKAGVHCEHYSPRNSKAGPRCLAPIHTLSNTVIFSEFPPACKEAWNPMFSSLGRLLFPKDAPLDTSRRDLSEKKVLLCTSLHSRALEQRAFEVACGEFRDDHGRSFPPSTKVGSTS